MIPPLSRPLAPVHSFLSDAPFKHPERPLDRYAILTVHRAGQPIREHGTWVQVPSSRGRAPFADVLQKLGAEAGVKITSRRTLFFEQAVELEKRGGGRLQEVVEREETFFRLPMALSSVAGGAGALTDPPKSMHCSSPQIVFELADEWKDFGSEQGEVEYGANRVVEKSHLRSRFILGSTRTALLHPSFLFDARL